MMGDPLNYCYDCAYCCLNAEKNVPVHNPILPSYINNNFVNLPVTVNLFYGDPLL
jgi:hypothetical protein